MELELKHLAAYLPYGLCLMYKKRPEHFVVALGAYEPTDTGILYFKADFADWQPITPFLPILKPMCQLTREELKDKGFWTYCDFLTSEHQSDPKRFPIENAPHKMVEYLLSRHYDIFDLISKGLAVEK